MRLKQSPLMSFSLSLFYFVLEHFFFSSFEGVRRPPSRLPPKDKDQKHKTKRTKTIKAIATLPSVARNDWLSGSAIATRHAFGSRLWLTSVARNDYILLFVILSVAKNLAFNAPSQSLRRSAFLMSYPFRHCEGASFLSVIARRQ